MERISIHHISNVNDKTKRKKKSCLNISHGCLMEFQSQMNLLLLRRMEVVHWDINIKLKMNERPLKLCL